MNELREVLAEIASAIQDNKAPTSEDKLRWWKTLAAAIEENEAIWKHCRVVYFPPMRLGDKAIRYPIEHNAAAGKMGRENILATLAQEKSPYSTREGMNPVERLIADAEEKKPALRSVDDNGDLVAYEGLGRNPPERRADLTSERQGGNRGTKGT